jgi:lipid-A-disaccharide synthase
MNRGNVTKQVQVKPVGSPLPSMTGEGALRGKSQTQDRLQLEIKVGHTAEIMQWAAAGLVASGSATLEAAYYRLPFVLVYKVSWITYLAGRILIRVKYLGMPNVLADKEIVPEFIQYAAKPTKLACAVLGLLDNPTAREKMISEFDAIIRSLGETGASERAARAVLEELDTARESR